MASIWDMCFPWTLTLSTVIITWLMVSPDAFGVEIQTTPSDINHLGEALIVVISVISMAECLEPVVTRSRDKKKGAEVFVERKEDKGLDLSSSFWIGKGSITMVSTATPKEEEKIFSSC